MIGNAVGANSGVRHYHFFYPWVRVSPDFYRAVLTALRSHLLRVFQQFFSIFGENIFLC